MPADARQIAIEAAAKAIQDHHLDWVSDAELALDAILTALRATYGEDALLAMDGTVVRAEHAGWHRDLERGSNDPAARHLRTCTDCMAAVHATKGAELFRLVPAEAIDARDDGPSRFPDRIAIDAKGFGWRVWDDVDHWSMVPTNPDNSPIPQPVTWYVPISDKEGS